VFPQSHGFVGALVAAPAVGVNNGSSGESKSNMCACERTHVIDEKVDQLAFIRYG
jgi:hypothetical protein